MIKSTLTKKIRHASRRVISRITKRQYRAMLLLGGVLLYFVHHHCESYEINVVLLLHAMVTLDPTV